MTAATARKRAPAKKAAPRGTARIPKRSQGWYRDPETSEKLRSVTTILNQGVPKESLIFWAGNITAQSAIDNLPHLLANSRDPIRRAEAYEWLRRAHTRKKDERADVGQAVHKIVEALLLELPLPDEFLDDEAMAPFLEHFLAFVRDWQVTFTASEMVVANYTDGYAGTLDFTARSALVVEELRAAGYLVADDVDLMGDTKTGGTWRRILDYSGHVHGVYPEAGLQMSAYRRGEVCWLRDGSKVPMPATAEIGIVLHLRPEGYDVYPAWCGEDLYPYFLHAKQVAEFTSRVASAKADRPVIGAALKVPTATRGAA